MLYNLLDYLIFNGDNIWISPIIDFFFMKRSLQNVWNWWKQKWSFLNNWGSIHNTGNWLGQTKLRKPLSAIRSSSYNKVSSLLYSEFKFLQCKCRWRKLIQLLKFLKSSSILIKCKISSYLNLKLQLDYFEIVLFRNLMKKSVQ